MRDKFEEKKQSDAQADGLIEGRNAVIEAGPNKPSRNDKNGGGDNKKKAPVSFLGIVLWAVVPLLLLQLQSL